MRGETLILINNEQVRAVTLHPRTQPGAPNITMERSFAILVEEVGEVAKSTLDLTRGNLTADEAKAELNHLLCELVQVASVASTWIDNLLTPLTEKEAKLIKEKGPKG